MLDHWTESVMAENGEALQKLVFKVRLLSEPVIIGFSKLTEPGELHDFLFESLTDQLLR